ncbi:MAG: LacI family DNA-binding transcriptional regulator [Gemmatimonadaceae bacterium]
MVTVKDVAREAEVSVATVSRTFSGAQFVRPEVRERVLAVAGILGYKPNAVARSLRSENTYTLGLVVPNIMNPFFTAVARVVEDEARERGYSLVLGNTDENPDKEARYLDVLLQKRIDGLILSPARESSPHLREVERAGVPMVFLDRYVEGVDAPVIRADGKKAVDRLVAYLGGLGHEKLAIISGPPETVSGGERLKAFIEGAASCDVSVPEKYIRLGDFRRQSGKTAMGELLGLKDPPTAVFAANNLMALGALQMLSEAGVGVPEEISFASFDDVSWFPLVSPPVTAVAQPVEELGAATARILPDMVEGKEQPHSVILEAELVVRGSCAEPSGGATPGRKTGGPSRQGLLNGEE